MWDLHFSFSLAYAIIYTVGLGFLCLLSTFKTKAVKSGFK